MDNINQQNDKLMDQLIDLKFKLSKNKEVELIEFLRDLYESLDHERLKEYSKSEIINNLKEYIETFIKDNNIHI